jgi:hypothetical protein
MRPEWNEINVETAGLRLRSPEELEDAGAQGIDSPVTTLEGASISVTVDAGPFCDPLTSYADRPEHHLSHETIAGRPARVVSFRLEEDEGHFAGAHFEPTSEGAPGPDQATVSAIARAEREADVALEVVRSVEFV